MLMMYPMQDAIETFKRDLALLRERVGLNLRGGFEEDLQNFSNRRFNLVAEFAGDKKRIEEIVAEHHRLAPQLRLRVLTGR
jgi:hypothetical protein